MSALPVITAIGGISPAGRSSCQHGFNRIIYDALDHASQQRTLAALAALSNAPASDALLESTLIRRLERNLFDSARMPFNMAAQGMDDSTLVVRSMDLPSPLPAHWRTEEIDSKRTRLTLPVSSDLLVPSFTSSRANAAGQLPSGFEPSTLYSSRNHPRGLQMALYGASDCLGMTGIPWETIRQHVNPEQIAVYASAAMSNLDENGFGGMLKNPSNSKRITSKQCPLGMGEMAADFINAYVLGSVGRTGGMLGTCATFLYNLSLGIQDIRSGKARVALIGTAEAPLIAEVMQGYQAMGALAEDAALMQLDGNSTQPDWRRACRPFAENCGFTLAESAQFILLMDDELALSLGADILGAVPDVFIHSDGIKKSISSPGIGNYLTFARATGLARNLLGDQGLREHTFVSAHGTGTPKNRVTESHVINEVARAFGIEKWPLAAVKCYVGHSLGSAGGDQLMAALGTFNSGILPGISTLNTVADDVHHSNLSIQQAHRKLNDVRAGLINAKGFGGNNATALVLSGTVAMQMLQRKHGASTVQKWQASVEQTRAQRDDYDAQTVQGKTHPIYRFGEPELAGEAVEISRDSITLPGWKKKVSLTDTSSFKEYLS